MDHLKSEKEYLNETLRIIENQLSSLGSSFRRREKDLYEASKYMWEELPGVLRNSDEMNLFASQNDLIVSIQQNVDETELQIKTLSRMRSSPYFGRVDFIPDRGEPFSAYIGSSTLMDKSTFTTYVCDWRAPVASLFYENGCGQTSFESPNGTEKGRVTLLRQFKIEDGEIRLMLDSDVKIDDSLLLSALSSDSSQRMKTIVSTIQREQNAVIRDAQNDMLLVLGPAGSGKTSIALHRIAYLLYRDRNKLKSSNVLIFSPNEIFSDYISEVIPDLGESDVPQTTFCDLIKVYCGAETEGLYSQLEFIASEDLTDEDRLRRRWIALKGSTDFALLAREFAVNYTPGYRDIVFNGTTVMSAAEMKAIFTKNSKTDVLTRLAHLRDTITQRLSPHKKAFREKINRELDDISGNPVRGYDLKQIYDETVAETLSAVAECTSVSWDKLYTKFLRYAVKRMVADPEERKKLISDGNRAMARTPLYYEDGVGLLLLKASFGAIPRQTRIKHIVIDEVQDYCPAQHEIFRLLFPHCRFTVLGDLLQLINSGMGADSPEKILNIYGFKRSEVRILGKSYRSTEEISKVASAVLSDPPEYDIFNRHGEPVRFVTAENRSELKALLASELKLIHSNGHATALICRTAAECRKLYQQLKPQLPELHLVCTDNDPYHHGLVVMPLALAKGMEFDGVVVSDSSLYFREEDRNHLYVACSRAMHRLTVCSVGAHSPLFPQTIISKGE
ncbi:MAG: AAA family ATPase [Clostridia bacterium]|nr:AAA family ATPase [Clostridia bacterium]